MLVGSIASLTSPLQMPPLPFGPQSSSGLRPANGEVPFLGLGADPRQSRDDRLASLEAPPPAKQQAWRRCIFALALFHAAVIERQRFGALGWNIPYDFVIGDLHMSVQMLTSTMQPRQHAAPGTGTAPATGVGQAWVLQGRHSLCTARLGMACLAAVLTTGTAMRDSPPAHQVRYRDRAVVQACARMPVCVCGWVVRPGIGFDDVAPRQPYVLVQYACPWPWQRTCL
jgi:Dynein heavy chain AAA lid domain